MQILQKFKKAKNVLIPSNWRQHFTQQLIGKGIEIGPLHRPIILNDSPHQWADYVDCYPLEELRKVYKELKDCNLVAPTIIDNGETLQTVMDESYDFLVAAHVIEHMKNPIKALQNWMRVTKPGGLIYLIVPDKRMTFDLHRPLTSLTHLIYDYEHPSDERDFEHFIDYSNYVHNLRGLDALRDAKNLQAINYSIHFHVFIPENTLELLQWFQKNISPLTIKEGPVQSVGSDEFHFLLQK